MTFTNQPLPVKPICCAHAWKITDVDRLARLVAMTLVGQYRRVLQTIYQLKKIPQPAGATSAMIDAVRKELAADSDEDTWQRDGLLFQTISWLAAAHAQPDRSILNPPHLQKSFKGFDGLQLRLKPSRETVSYLLIFEDKATTSPRDTVRDKVWPEFAQIDQGERDNELMQALTSLLERFPDIDPDHAIQQLVWRKVRRYRLAVNTPVSPVDEEAAKRLLKGYDTSVSGPRYRRTAELFEISDLRSWLQDFVQRVFAHLDVMREEYV